MLEIECRILTDFAHARHFTAVLAHKPNHILCRLLMRTKKKNKKERRIWGDEMMYRRIEEAQTSARGVRLRPTAVRMRARRRGTGTWP
jgi:hypothetical protein